MCLLCVSIFYLVKILQETIFEVVCLLDVASVCEHIMFDMDIVGGCFVAVGQLDVFVVC